MKIAHFCEFADKRSGVFRAVLEIAKKQGNSTIFTTHFTKDYKINNQNEIIEGIEVRKIKAKRMGGESFNWWNIKDLDLSEFDIAYSHGYRRHHNIFLQDFNIKRFLVTHAPWGGKGTKRNLTTKTFDIVYKNSIEKNFIILHIAKWEKEETLFKKDFKIIEIPLRKEFYKPLRNLKREGILYVGWRGKIKDFLENTDAKITIIENVFDVNKLVRVFDKHKYFILPTLREGLPQALREAKQRKLITIATKNKGTEEVGADYFFNYGDWNKLNCFLKELK